MFRMGGKLCKDGRLLRDCVISDSDYSRSRTAMVFAALDEICRKFDLESPIWLEANIREFQRMNRTRFGQDSFIETIPFDYLEISVIEE